MERILCLAMGYAFGLIQTGYFYGKLHSVDLHKYGSGNVGTTNALRVMGKKAGALVFLGDFFKAIIAVELMEILFSGNQSPALLGLYAGFGVVLGHNFPFYLKFKGGKGIASMAGIMAAFDIRVALVCLVIFVAAVAITRYVSLGSILVVITFFAGCVYFGSRGDYRIASGDLRELYIVVFVLMAMAIWRHRSNIGRLMHGTENKLWGNKK